jgi:hypothetical protein
MLDLSKTLEAKSDHLSADDLIGGSKTIKITKVSLVNGDRPVVIDYVGGDGKSYLPCKSMRRVMASVWGLNGTDWVGHSLVLYRDNSVKFGGQEVGGIRISHMTGINAPVKLSLSASRGKKSLFQVRPMNDEAVRNAPKFKSLDIIEQEQVPEKQIEDIKSDIDACETHEQLAVLYKSNASHSLVTEIIKLCTERKAVLLAQQEPQKTDGELNV